MPAALLAMKSPRHPFLVLGRCLFVLLILLIGALLFTGLQTSLVADAGADDLPLLDSGSVLRSLGVIFGLVVLNGFFVASEFAIVRVRIGHFEALKRPQSRTARLAREIYEHSSAYLSASQLGITISSLALGWLGEVFIADAIARATEVSGTSVHAIALLIAFAFVVSLHVVLGELIPKALASHHPVKTLLLVARPLRGFFGAFQFPIFLLNKLADFLIQAVFRINPERNGEFAHSSEELRLMVEEGKGVSDVTDTEREIVSNALELSDLAVRDVMTPRKDVVSLDANASFEENWDLVKSSKHTRFPLIDGHLDQTLGLVHIKDIIDLLDAPRQNKNLRAIAKPFDAVPELMPVDRVLGKFLKEHTHLTIVVDEYGGSVGIVSLEDLLEEVVGDIRDEFDEELDEQEFYPIDEDEFRVKGSLGLYELSDYCDLQLETPDVSTIGGYVTQCFGRMPEVGETIQIENYLATVTSSDGLRIEELHFKRMPEPVPEEEEGDGGEPLEATSETEAARREDLSTPATRNS